MTEGKYHTDTVFYHAQIAFMHLHLFELEKSFLLCLCLTLLLNQVLKMVWM